MVRETQRSFKRSSELPDGGTVKAGQVQSESEKEAFERACRDAEGTEGERDMSDLEITRIPEGFAGPSKGTSPFDGFLRMFGLN